MNIEYQSNFSVALSIPVKKRKESYTQKSDKLNKKTCIGAHVSARIEAAIRPLHHSSTFNMMMVEETHYSCFWCPPALFLPSHHLSQFLGGM